MENQKSTTVSSSDGRDPSGFIFEDSGQILRGIHPEFEAFFRSILKNDLIKEMIGSQIIDTEITTTKQKNFPLVLCHRKIVPVNYCYEWPSLMLKDAGELTLDICLKLIRGGIILKDATPWNVVYEYGKPIFIDFASIMPQENDLMWVALDQFYRLFLFPMLLCEAGFGRTGRSLLLSSQQGISDAEIGKFIRAGYWRKHPWLLNRLYLPKMLVSMLRSSGQDQNIGKYLKNVKIESAQRIKFFETLVHDFSSIQVNLGKSRWSQYYEDINSFLKPQMFHKKQQVVADVLAKQKPKTVVDIGCNQGGYSILAAQAGASVIAFDTDEDSINMLYLLVKEKDLKILPLIMDVTNPSPAAGWRAAQYPSAIERYRSEGALALALTHHLAITQNQSFDRIARELSDFCTKWVITEYVPESDPRVKELLLTNRRDMSWYSLEGLIAALKKEFKDVVTYDSFPEGRVLCFCTK